MMVLVLKDIEGFNLVQCICGQDLVFFDWDGIIYNNVEFFVGFLGMGMGMGNELGGSSEQKREGFFFFVWILFDDEFGDVMDGGVLVELSLE